MGEATQAIIDGIAVQGAGTNCSIWVEEGVQCGGLVRRQRLPSCFVPTLLETAHRGAVPLAT